MVLMAVLCAAQENRKIEYVTEAKSTVTFQLRADWQRVPTELPKGVPLSDQDRAAFQRGYIGRWVRSNMNLSVLIEQAKGACNARNEAERFQKLRVSLTPMAKLVSAAITEPRSGTADLRMHFASQAGPDSQVRLERFVCSGAEVIHFNASLVTRAPADFAKISLETALRGPFESLTITRPNGK